MVGWWSHWLNVSNINWLDNTVNIYDTVYCDLPHGKELTDASLVATKFKKKMLGKKGGKDQELKQSSTTPDPEYHMGK